MPLSVISTETGKGQVGGEDRQTDDENVPQHRRHKTGCTSAAVIKNAMTRSNLGEKGLLHSNNSQVSPALRQVRAGTQQRPEGCLLPWLAYLLSCSTQEAQDSKSEVNLSYVRPCLGGRGVRRDRALELRQMLSWEEDHVSTEAAVFCSFPPDCS